MNKIFKIAKLELSVLFYSPVAWLILIIFTLQCGMSFIDLLEAREASQQLGSNLQSLTLDIFSGNRGFFASVQRNLYLYIPLLTMGLMSRELSSGSIKLLYSSPLTSGQIILGKFLSMMLYGLLLMGVLLIIILVAWFSVEALDFGYLFGALLGLYFLLCAYSAIGLFMSSLTSYQVVAAISTLAVLALLNFVGTIGQSIDFVREITYWVAIEGRADNFINGLISSKDVIYFLLVISLFITLSVMRLNSGREIRSEAVHAMRYAGVVIGVLAIGYVSSLPVFNGYFDTTRFKDNTLTQNSRDLLEKLEGPVKITNYVNVVNSFSHLGAPKWRIFDRNQFDMYTRFLPDLELVYKPYYDYTLDARDETDVPLEDRALRYATAHGFDFASLLRPEEIKQEVDLEPEGNLFVRKVGYNGQSSFMRMFYDMQTYPKEAEISAAIKRLLQAPPVVGFLSGNDERSVNQTGDKDYKNITNTLTSRGALINQGFDVKEITIDEYDQIPRELAALVIADPYGMYSNQELAKIDSYIASGGNLLVVGEPNKQAILNAVVDTMGVTFNPGMLLQETKDIELDVIQGQVAPEAAALGFEFRERDIISLSGAVTLDVSSSNFKVIPLLKTRETKVWNYEQPLNLETDTLVFHPGIDPINEAPVGVALTRTVADKDQKIMVIGDADFPSNGELGRFNLQTKNYEFTSMIFKWFSDGEFPIDTTRPEPIDNKILVSQGQISWLEKLLVGGLPLALGLAGGFLLIRRKRQ